MLLKKRQLKKQPGVTSTSSENHTGASDAGGGGAD